MRSNGLSCLVNQICNINDEKEEARRKISEYHKTSVMNGKWSIWNKLSEDHQKKILDVIDGCLGEKYIFSACVKKLNKQGLREFGLSRLTDSWIVRMITVRKSTVKHETYNERVNRLVPIEYEKTQDVGAVAAKLSLTKTGVRNILKRHKLL